MPRYWGRPALRSAMIAGALVTAAAIAPAPAAEKVHAGTAVALWAFLPLQIGIDQGIWSKYGIDLDITNSGSDAKLQQAMAAGSIDIGLGSGAAMALPRRA